MIRIVVPALVWLCIAIGVIALAMGEVRAAMAAFGVPVGWAARDTWLELKRAWNEL